jgi:predicted acylesterase/phospholipase RssA
LYNQTHFGTKYLINDFIRELLEATSIIRDSEYLTMEQKLEFFRHCRRAYGRTALILSGGAGFGYYHLGVVKALYEAHCLPKIISGTSAGSMIAALVCVRTDDELPELLTPDVHKYFTACDESWFVRIRRLLTERTMFDDTRWANKLRISAKGDMTFIEAYRRTGRILNITTTSTNKYSSPMLLNYITSPNVIIWSAVLASCSLPYIIKPVELMEKDPATQEIRPFCVHGEKWSDGSIKHDIPIEQLTMTHNANWFFASQVNPHVLPFVYDADGSSGRPSPRRFGSRLRGGFLSSALEQLLKLEMRKWLQLIAQMDLMPTIMGQDWRFTFVQPMTGTITVFPKPHVIDYIRIITDPTPEHMERFLLLSQRNTWPKLARIANHFIIERTLREYERYLLARAQTPLTPRRTNEEAAARAVRSQLDSFDESWVQQGGATTEGEGEGEGRDNSDISLDFAEYKAATECVEDDADKAADSGVTRESLSQFVDDAEMHEQVRAVCEHGFDEKSFISHMARDLDALRLVGGQRHHRRRKSAVKSHHYQTHNQVYDTDDSYIGDVDGGAIMMSQRQFDEAYTEAQHTDDADDEADTDYYGSDNDSMDGSLFSAASLKRRFLGPSNEEEEEEEEEE